MKTIHFEHHDLTFWLAGKARHWLGFYTFKNWDFSVWDFWQENGYFVLHTPAFYFYRLPTSNKNPERGSGR